MPHTLFMEKHSDSANESEKAFRRHLEEYIQAHQLNALTEESKKQSILVVNLIYGEEGGWKKTILTQAKQLLRPTIYLPEREYYKELKSIVVGAVNKHSPNFGRKHVKSTLLQDLKSSPAALAFEEEISELIKSPPPDSATHRKWINKAISTNPQSVVTSTDRSPTYARRGLTELLLLPENLRNWALNSLATGKTSFRGENLKPHDTNLLSLYSNGISKKVSVGTVRIVRPNYWGCGAEVSVLSAKLNELTEIFFAASNKAKMESNDHLAYFDILDDSFVATVALAAKALILALNGNRDEIIHLLTQPPAKCSFATKRDVGRTQNLNLESIIAISSVVASIANDRKRTDLSVSKLSRLSGISESRLNSIRSGATCKEAEAKSIIAAGTSFLSDACGDINTAIEIAEIAMNELSDWDNPATHQAPPVLLDPKIVMSIAWIRHNQLNSHPIFNPLGALHWQAATHQIPDEFECHGFPKKRSADVLQIASNNPLEVGSYEFSCVFWSKARRELRIHETSSVIGKKHSSDKCKELCARIRMTKSILGGKCCIRANIVIDGDWDDEHITALHNAGWDNVIYSEHFMGTLI